MNKFEAFKTLDDATLVETISAMFASGLCEDEATCLALGPAYHKRQERNYVTWEHTYVNQVETRFSKEELTSCPTTWSIGALTPAGAFYSNVLDGFKAGIEVGLMTYKHFPQVTIPEILAEHIKTAAEKYL